MKQQVEIKQETMTAKRALRVAILLVLDVLFILLSSFLALWMRFDFNIASVYELLSPIEFPVFLAISVVCSVCAFVLLRLYSSLWLFAGLNELLRIAAAALISSILTSSACWMSGLDLPRSYLPFNAGILFFVVTLCRFSYRYLRKYRTLLRKNRIRTMIVGAGQTGDCILRELQGGNHSENHVVCLIDDDPLKKGNYMHGVRIYGGRDAILETAKELDVQEIIIAMPTATNAQRQEILEICHQTGCKMRMLPGIFQLANGEVRVEQLRNVEIEDLLGRDSVQVDWNEITQYVHGKTILVTGGGGSIGSELCRQIAKQQPRQLILFDIYENSSYSVQQELLHTYPDLNLTVLIGSVRDEKRVNSIFATYPIDLVYHAAAHKHVPLMEDSPAEAVKNNIFGTRNVARAAGAHGVTSFVMISTDKAVNPTNVMGASKRACEMVVQHTASLFPNTKFVSVRFGNVLGSNGSVIPLFRKQIEEGGPVTVTHPDIIRYFMTIPEAVSLVLQAATQAKGGEIFVLDMGDPVKIDDLARKMIRLSGLEPDVDIPIVYTGLRPGEKLYEELLLAEEGVTSTPNKKIFIGRQIPVDGEKLDDLLQELLLCEGKDDDLRSVLKRVVPTYRWEKQEAVAAK